MLIKRRSMRHSKGRKKAVQRDTETLPMVREQGTRCLYMSVVAITHQKIKL